VIGDHASWWTPAKIVEGVVLGAVMFPLIPGIGANGSSLDGPTWTLLPELVANFFYALTIRFLNTWVLALIILVSGAGVVFTELHYGRLDVGFGATEQGAALARVGFSFFTGVLLFRFFGEREHKSTLAAWICVAVLTAVLAYSPPKSLMAIYELGVVLLGFPVLLILAARFEAGAFSGRVFSVTGLSSYGVYIFHQPLGNLARTLMQGRVHLSSPLHALAFGVGFVVVISLLAWWLDHHYDAPVRGWLRDKLLARKRPAT
jgi:peptidoglycan/LPS O-acetylase OafA/YrhL